MFRNPDVHSSQTRTIFLSQSCLTSSKNFLWLSERITSILMTPMFLSFTSLVRLSRSLYSNGCTTPRNDLGTPAVLRPGNK